MGRRRDERGGEPAQGPGSAGGEVRVARRGAAPRQPSLDLLWAAATRGEEERRDLGF